MEAAQVNDFDEFEEGALSDGLDDKLIEGPNGVPSFNYHSNVMVASFDNKKQSKPGDQHLQDSSMHLGISCNLSLQVPTSVPGVSKCYVFKSQLQEYAQKVGLPTPVYETIKEGPSHEPSFRSTVIVDGARYDSLPGFFNRKAAEQSAAEVALMDLSKSGGKKDSIAVPVHETGLCKNLLQEYAQKMNYAIPTYICRKDDTPGKAANYSCTVEIGAIQYIGASARNKKEAEIKAARTALLAIRSSGTVGQKLDNRPQYTVVPGKRKMSEIAPLQAETVKVKKPKKARKSPNQMQPCDLGHQSQTGIMGVLVSNGIGTPTAIQQFDNGLANDQVPNCGRKPNCLASSDQDNWPMKNNHLNGEASVVGVVDSSQTHVTASNSQADYHRNTCSAETSVQLADASRNHDVIDVIPLKKAPPSVQSDEENNDQGVDGEASVVEGASNSVVGVVDSSQTKVTASSSQADNQRNHDVGDKSDDLLMAKDPPSVQSDEENDDQGVDKVTRVVCSTF